MSEWRRLCLIALDGAASAMGFGLGLMTVVPILYLCAKYIWGWQI